MVESKTNIAILARQLSKKFPKTVKPAVSDLDLSISTGESVAFLGPNGAGKSTTIKMLCGILTPDQGEAFILGERAGAKTANLNLGLVFGARSQLYFHMSVEQCLYLQAETYYVPPKEQSLRINELVETFEVQHLLKKKVRELSLGERMRCEIIASLVHKPKVILLDEPTIGLDINAKHKLRSSLKEWQKKEKTTMMLTSHDLSDVEALCDRCILINHGVKTYDGPLELVKGDLARVRRISIFLAPSAGEITLDTKTNLAEITQLTSDDPFEQIFEFHLDKIPIGKVIDHLSQNYGSSIQDIQISGVTLEEVIHKQYTSKSIQ